MVGTVVGQGGDGAAREAEAAIVLGLLEENDLDVAVVEAPNDYDFLVDFDDGNEGREFFVVEASLHGLDAVADLLLL